MKVFTKILAYYSIFLCVAILIIGIITSRESTGILLNLIFLPVLLYLIFASLSRRNAEISEKSDSTYMSFIFIFLVLFLFGVYNVYNNSQKKEQPTRDLKSSPIIIHSNE